MPDRADPSADEQGRTKARSSQSAWVGGGIAAIVLALVLRVLNQASVAGIEWLSHWYVQAAIVVAGVLVYGAAHWLIGRGSRQS